jgi:hydrogenase maturation protease
LPGILIYGVGNPGRQDDALGILLVKKMDAWILEKKYTCITTDQNYQLNIEDAESISHYDLVIFLDASVNEIESVLIEPVIPDLKMDFSMHHVTPSFIVGLCRHIFNRIPEAYQLHIKAYKFNFVENISARANKSLIMAFKLLTEFLENYMNPRSNNIV